jgi:hypothetical protein
MFGASQVFGATQNGNVVSSSGGQKRKQDEAVLPVTIRSIEDALLKRQENNGELQFYGREQGMLVLVACVEDVKKTDMSLQLSLNDGSGRIKARHYISENTKKHADAVAAGRYVNVVGSVRTSPEVHFGIQMLKPVDSADDVSFHMIEVAHSALKLMKGKGGQSDPLTPSRPVAAKPLEKSSGGWEISPPKLSEPKADEEMPQVSSTTAPPAAEKPPPTPASAAAGPLKGAPLKKAVMDFLQKEGEGKAVGVSLSAVYKHFYTLREDEVKGVLDEFVENGDACNTIDDKHFMIV